MQLETCQAPLSSHLNTRIFSLACAAYPGAHIILSYWDNTEQSQSVLGENPWLGMCLNVAVCTD